MPPPAAPPRSGWRQENPSPAAFALRGAWAASPNDVWAVGDNGTIEHFDGTAWSLIASPVTTSLDAVWGSGATDVWAAGDEGTLVHYDGRSWTRIASGTTAPIGVLSGTAADDIWASTAAVPFIPGTQGGAPAGATLLHFDGQRWKTVASDAPTAVAAVGRDDVWVGSCGAVRHFDGKAWTSFTTPDGCISQLAGVPGGPVFAVNSSGTFCNPHAAVLCPKYGLLRFDGSAWVASDGPAGYLAARDGRVWAFSGGPWVPNPDALARFEGTAWTTLATADIAWGLFAGPNALAAVPGGDAWIVGEGGRRIRYRGAGLEEPEGFRTNSIWSLSGPSDCDLWAVGTGKLVLHRGCDGAWSFVDVFSGGLDTASDTFLSVASTAPDDVWLLDGFGYVHHFDGRRWTREGRFAARKLFAVARGEAYLAEGGFFHRDGTGWHEVTTGYSVMDVWGSSPRDVWFTSWGLVEHFDGTGRMPAFSYSVPQFHASSSGITGTAHDDVWFGAPGPIWHFDGSSWNSVPGTDAVNADAIASGGRGALWAASTAGGNKPVHVFRFDGRTWTDTAAPTAGALSLFSTATTVYGYGANGQIISHPR